MIRLAVLASGGGSNFQALIDNVKNNNLDAEIILLISNNSTSGAIQKAKKSGIESLHLASSAYKNENDYTAALLGHLRRVKADLIVLAGYMKQIPNQVIKEYKNRILNIHPALLPAFGGKGMYGHFVHEAVIEYGAKFTGVTVHIVDEEYDNGPVVMQKIVEVKENDTPQTLAERVLSVEHDTYWRAIQLFAQNRIKTEKRKVILL